MINASFKSPTVKVFLNLTQINDVLLDHSTEFRLGFKLWIFVE